MKTFILFSIFCIFNSYSVTIAILDSGTDFEHTFLADKMWENTEEIPGDFRDNDGNLYRDDYFGWNFAGSDSHIINPKYYGTFSTDPHRVINMQAEIIKNGFSSSAMGCYCSLASENPRATCKTIDYKKIYRLTKLEESDFQWLCSKRDDKEFSAEMGRFGNFAHGTHVAHIASRRSPESKIMGLKLLPTEIGEVLSEFHFKRQTSLTTGFTEDEGRREQILKGLLEALAEAQLGTLKEAFDYIKDQNVSVVNGSFGTPFEAIKRITDIAYRVIYFKKPTAEQSTKTASIFFDAHVKGVEELLKRSPNTVFVFAAGNSGLNNDVYPTSPTNASLPNVISVAATIDRIGLAGFSNYGVKEVDIAAPGVAINAAIPSVSHSEMLPFSGTSQASPYVAGVVAKVREVNKFLQPAAIKEILIKTVDKKDFMEGKVTANGIIHDDRAIRVAKMMLGNIDIDTAIKYANKNIPAMIPKISFPTDIPPKSQDTSEVFSFMPDFGDDPKTRKAMQSVLNSFQ